MIALRITPYLDPDVCVNYTREYSHALNEDAVMNVFTRIVWGALLACCLIGFAGGAFAAEVVFNNESEFDADFAIIFYDKTRKDWYIAGWYRVAAGKELAIDFPNDPKRQTYFFARDAADKIYWPEDGEHTYWVLDGKMNHKVSEMYTYRGSFEVEMGKLKADVKGKTVITID